jgi:hypothetical protein
MINKDKISLLGIRALYDRFVTNKYITKVWMVMSFPVHYDLNFTQMLRAEMFKLHPNVKTYVHYTSRPVNINVHNNLFMKQYERVAGQYNSCKEFFDNLTADQKLAGVSEVDPSTGRKVSFDAKTLAKIQEEYDSYLYLFSQVTNGHQFTDTSFFIQASAKTKKELKMYQKSLENLLTGQEIYFKEIHGMVGEYLSNCCPATYVQPNSKRFATVLLSDVNQAGLVPTKTKGLLGGKGIMLGVDAQTGLPFILNFFGSGTAQVIMMLGKTGCGKTYAGFFIAMGLAALGVHFSAIDIKGDEWTKMFRYVDGVSFDMGGQNSRFVNTLRLDDLVCTSKEAAEEAFQTAVNGTVEIFKIIINLQPDEGNIVDLETILRQAVTKLYHNKDVISDNPKTFSRTRGLWYSDVLNVVTSLKLSSSYDEQYRKLCGLILTRCSTYFMPEGLYADAFRNEITLKEILEAPAVVYSFNKNQGDTLGTLDSLRVFMVQFLDGKKQYMRKKQKLHTAAFYEELQRCKSFGSLVSEISHKVTGSRSNNVMIFLLFNSLATLDDKDFSAIKSNITTKIVGKVEDGDIDKLTNEYGCVTIKKYLEDINSDEQGAYQHCFAIQYDTGLDVDKTIFRTVMPAEMSDNFNTRDRMDI